nr:sigma-70 family RNA polymerase sigma factor [Metabacillus iocasae]
MPIPPHTPSFEEIVHMFDPLIKSQLKKLCIYKDYDEFYQVGVIGLWEAYKKYDPTQGEFSTYAYTMVRGHLLTHLKKVILRQEREPLFTESDRIQEIQVESAPMIEETSLLEAYNTLSNREKIYVKRYMIEGYSMKEIADECGVSYQTVKDWAKRAKTKLRVFYEKQQSNS